MKWIPYARQSINENDLNEVAASIKGDFITRGPKVNAFEKAVADYCDVKHAVAFSSGSAALMAAYFAADVKPFDRIISTPNTFIATIGYAVQKKATPVFVDIDTTTGNLNLEQVKFNLEYQPSRGRNFVVPVHFSGIAVDMEKLYGMLTDPDTVVIEDAAHALGSRYSSKGPKVGSCAWSDMTMFSFHPAKNITCGEGGMVTTNDDALHHRLKLFRDNGIEREEPYLESAAALGYYEVAALTGNYHLTEMQGALGLSQMQRLDAFVEKRRELMQRYRKKLKNISHIKLLSDEYDSFTAFHLCVAQIDFKARGKDRVNVMKQLREKGVGTQIHYIPLYRHPIFQKGHDDDVHFSEFFPETEKYYAQALTLPLYFDMSNDDVDFVCDQLATVLS